MDESEADRHLVTEIRDAYAGSAQAWATGPVQIYRRLAAALVAHADEPWEGRRVLDLGAGTGVASEILSRAGARPVAVDLAAEMLAHHRERRPPGVAGDAQALPFRDGVFDAVAAACSLNHVPDLEAALGECQRVLRGGGRLLASTFPSGDDHPAKAIVEGVLRDHDYRRPAWYETFKQRIAELTGDADAFARAATSVGLADVGVDRVEVDAGLDDPRLAVEWRLNMPHTIGFVTGLPPSRQDALRARAVAAVPDDLPPAISMLVLHARMR